MASIVQCPHCNRRYSLRPELMGKEVVCMCGQTFKALAQGPSPANRPATGPSPSPAPAAARLEDLLSDALGLGTPPAPTDLATAAALDTATSFSGPLTTYRRRRMSGGDVAVLAVGIGLAVLGLACLLVLFRLLEITGLGWTATAMVLAVLGAGMIAVAQRRNLLIALPVGTAVCCLAVVGYVVRPLPKSLDQLVDECAGLGREYIATMESIHDEETLRQARPKLLATLKKIFQIAERGKQLEAEGRQPSAEKRRELEAVMQELGSRSAGAGQRLLDIRGGVELVQEILRISEDAQKRMAAIHVPPAPSGQPGPRTVSSPPSQVASTPSAEAGSLPGTSGPPPAASPSPAVVAPEPQPESSAADIPSGGFDVGPPMAREPGRSSTAKAKPAPRASPAQASASASKPAAAASDKPSPAPAAQPAASPADGPPTTPMPGPPGFPGTPGPFGNVGRRSETIGGSGGIPFFKARAGQTVVGLAFRSGTWANHVAIGQIEPLFDRSASAAGGPPMSGPLAAAAQRVVAKDGYAVGALVVDAGEYVLAVKPIFMKLGPDGKLDPAGRYEGPWLGQPSGKNPKTLDGNGAKVIGLHGLGAAVVDAVGLVFE